MIEIVNQQPNIFPLLALSAKWARDSGVINKEENRDGEKLKLNVFGVSYFLINFLIDRGYIEFDIKKEVVKINKKFLE